MKAALALLAAACATTVEVRLTPTGTLDLDAKAAPVSAVLECLAERTGMKVVTEGGAVPRRQVTLSLRDQTEVQAVYGLLEGLGINYALSTDPKGTRVRMLLLTIGGATTSSQKQTATPPVSAIETPDPAENNETVIVNEEAPPPPPPFMPSPGSARQPSFPAPAQPMWPGGPPPPGVLTPPVELFPEQRPLSPLSLRDAGRVRLAAGR